MNNQPLLMFIGVLLDEDDDRNIMRIARRNLRDEMNAFEVPNNRFKQMFRLDKISARNIIDNLQQYQTNTSFPMHIQVLTTLNFLATGSFQNSIGSNAWLSLSQTSVSRIVNDICSLITNHLLPIWVKFPTTGNEKMTTRQGFYEKWNIRGVLGAIDGTHVEIIAPPVADLNHPPFVYINRKGKHSINVMLISDSNLKILACCARYPGSVHDSAIWQVSQIKQHMMAQYEAGDLSHLLGDSGYPLEPWLFTPFANPADGTTEARFNEQLCAARNVIERTNGVLKGRFRCLSRHRVLLYHPTKAAKMIYSCCVLHNIAQAARLPIEENDIEYRDDNDNDNNIGNYVQIYRGSVNNDT